MRPYWIRVERRPAPTILNLGAGVTALSEADAREIFACAFGLQHAVKSIPPIRDMGEIDQDHVVPNMGNWFERGVWFPLGFAHIAASVVPRDFDL
jgi:hypothetical protein